MNADKEHMEMRSSLGKIAGKKWSGHHLNRTSRDPEQRPSWAMFLTSETEAVSVVSQDAKLSALEN
jgi:hypothetical protein